MKLTLTQIFERIPFSVEIRHQQEKSPQILRVRPYRSPLTNDSEDVLYIASAETALSDLPMTPIHVLWTGTPPDQEMPNLLSESACVSAPADAETLLLAVQDVITWYQVWEQRIMEDILKRKSLESTLALCAQALQNPVAVFDIQQNLLLSAGQIPDSSPKSGLWDYALDHKRSPEETEIEQEIGRSLLEHRAPFFFRSNNRFREIERLIAPLYWGESLFGMIAMSDITAPFTPGEYDNACRIQSYLETAIANTDTFYFNTHTTPWYIIQLLRGKTVNQEVLTYNMRRKGFQIEEPFFLWTFQKTESDETPLSSLMPNLAYTLGTSFVFHYARQIIVLLPNRKVGSNMCHVLRLPPFTAASKTALIKCIISEF